MKKVLGDNGCLVSRIVPSTGDSLWYGGRIWCLPRSMIQWCSFITVQWPCSMFDTHTHASKSCKRSVLPAEIQYIGSVSVKVKSIIMFAIFLNSRHACCQS
jgi:hypothetical protein